MFFTGGTTVATQKNYCQVYILPVISTKRLDIFSLRICSNKILGASCILNVSFLSPMVIEVLKHILPGNHNAGTLVDE